jgi:hypothetical protein
MPVSSPFSPAAHPIEIDAVFRIRIPRQMPGAERAPGMAPKEVEDGLSKARYQR